MAFLSNANRYSNCIPINNACSKTQKCRKQILLVRSFAPRICMQTLVACLTPSQRFRFTASALCARTARRVKHRVKKVKNIKQFNLLSTLPAAFVIENCIWWWIKLNSAVNLVAYNLSSIKSKFCLMLLSFFVFHTTIGSILLAGAQKFKLWSALALF